MRERFPSQLLQSLRLHALPPGKPFPFPFLFLTFVLFPSAQPPSIHSLTNDRTAKNSPQLPRLNSKSAAVAASPNAPPTAPHASIPPSSSRRGAAPPATALAFACPWTASSAAGLAGSIVREGRRAWMTRTMVAGRRSERIVGGFVSLFRGANR